MKKNADTYEQTSLFRTFNTRIQKNIMYEFWYDYLKANYGEKAKLCYMDTGTFIVYINKDNIYKDIT